MKEAILLERLTSDIKSIPLISEYFKCVNDINELLERIYFEENGVEYTVVLI